MPELLGGVLIAAFMALYLLFLLLKVILQALSGLVTNLWNHMTGETARREEQFRRNREAEEEQYRRVREAEEQFKRAILSGFYPSEEVLAILAKESIRLLPEDLRRHFGETVDDYEEAIQCVRKQIRVNKERVAYTRDHRELAESFARLVESCSVPWDELTRIAKAMHGPHYCASFATIVHGDILQILSVMSDAYGRVRSDLGGLYQAVAAQLEPKVYLDTVDCIKKISGCEHKPLRLPAAVELLHTGDQINKTNLAHKAAVSYWSLVGSAALCCADSRPTAIIEAAYFEKLKPFLSVNGSNGSSDESSSNGNNGNSNANSNSGCTKCAKFYAILRLEPDASKDEIETARRNLTQIYHPDRFAGSNNEGLRRTAEEETKKVNEAYVHVMEHFEHNYH
jgi:hypothetical protein